MGKRINIRPTTSVYATYKNINYQVWTAIAEFVDNSTQSYYSNIEKLKSNKYWKGLNVEIDYQQGKDGKYFLEIRDNAFGMDFNDFKRAIILDSKPLKTSRGEFGMGLKTAACWFGLKWSVESTALGNSKKYKATVDVEHLNKYKDEFIDVEESNCNPKEHYTIIRIWEMNRTIHGRTLGKTKSMLAGMYRVDLRTKDINILYNDEKLSFSDPDIFTEKLEGDIEKVWKLELDFTLEHNNKEFSVKGFVAIRKTASTSEAGLTLIRRGRVIIGGFDDNYRPKDIFGNQNSFEWQRLFGELHMDDWPVVQTKDNFDWNNGLEDKFIEKLILLFSDYIKKARSIRVRKRADLGEMIDITAKSFEEKGLISEVIISDYMKPANASDSKQKDSEVHDSNQDYGNDDENVVIFDNHKPKTISFRLGSQNYNFHLIVERDNEDAQWLKITKDKEDYTIIWNTRHVFFRKFMDNPDFLLIMQKFIFAFALSEVSSAELGESGLIAPASIRNDMNSMLKLVGEEW